jgi:hypothetical protein
VCARRREITVEIGEQGTVGGTRTCAFMPSGLEHLDGAGAVPLCPAGVGGLLFGVAAAVALL